MSQSEGEVADQLLAQYSTNTPYGTIQLEVHVLNPMYINVRVAGDFIGEWAENDEIEDIWEEVSAYNWEDPDEFPETSEEFVDYLAFCANHIALQFEHRIQRDVAKLIAEGERYFKRYRTSPTLEWLIEHYPKGSFSKPTPKFKQRVADAVLQHFQSQGQQLTLF